MTENSEKPIASVSVDLDNLWSYLKAHGDGSWVEFPSYLDVVVPRILDFVEVRKCQLTVFVVGQDAAQEAHHHLLRRIADAGHEIANHSHHHDPWLHLYTPDQLVEEFELSELAIQQATGQRTIGFRGPGFSYSHQVLAELCNRGYQYDASTFPTFLGPLARAYYFLSSKLTAREKEERKVLFGKFSAGFRPVKPFVWEIDGQSLLEIPVTTMPLARLPIHASYLLYLASFSTAMAKFYFWQAMKFCRLTGVEPSMLLHPTDFLDVHDAPRLSFFPAMKMPAHRKHKLIDHFLNTMEDGYRLVPLREHASQCLSKNLNRRISCETKINALSSVR